MTVKEIVILLYLGVVGAILLVFVAVMYFDKPDRHLLTRIWDGLARFDITQVRANRARKRRMKITYKRHQSAYKAIDTYRLGKRQRNADDRQRWVQEFQILLPAPDRELESDSYRRKAEEHVHNMVMVHNYNGTVVAEYCSRCGKLKERLN